MGHPCDATTRGGMGQSPTRQLMLPLSQGGEDLAPESLFRVRRVGAAVFFQAAVFSRSTWGEAPAAVAA